MALCTRDAQWPRVPGISGCALSPAKTKKTRVAVLLLLLLSPTDPPNPARILSSMLLVSGRARVQAGGALHHVHRRRRQARPRQAAHRQGLHGGPVQQDGEGGGGGQCSVTDLTAGEEREAGGRRD